MSHMLKILPYYCHSKNTILGNHKKPVIQSNMNILILLNKTCYYLLKKVEKYGYEIKTNKLIAF